MVNVETQLADPDSMLNLYRRLLALRKGSPALRIGSWLAHPASSEDLLVYRREADDETMTVALNLSAEERPVQLSPGFVVVSTADPGRNDATASGLLLGPYEGVIVSHR
jgi:alpha-glucosidase